MYKIIILIATTVVAINLVYTMLPAGGYEKYCKYIFGLVLVLIFAGTVTKIDISSDILNFNNNIPVFDSTKIEETFKEETEQLIVNNILSMLKSNRIFADDITVLLENNEISEIKVYMSGEANKEEIISLISSYCDINKDAIMIE